MTAPNGGQVTGSPVSGGPQTGLVADKDARMWAMIAHLSALVGVIIPFGNIIAPLVIWLIKREESPFIDDQGKEALNFNITVGIAGLVAGVLTAILIGFLLLLAVGIYALIFIIMAAMAANKGELYRYPLTLRLVK